MPNTRKLQSQQILKDIRKPVPPKICPICQRQRTSWSKKHPGICKRCEIVVNRIGNGMKQVRRGNG